jgi:hypothetical protein
VGSDFWRRARRARDELAEQLRDHPHVSLVDIGYAMVGSEGPSKVMLRIHLRGSAAEEGREVQALPREVDGIPVVVLPDANYREET